MKLFRYQDKNGNIGYAAQQGVNSLLNPDEAIQIPQFMRSDEVDYECELAVVIGKPCNNVSRAKALKYVLGEFIKNCHRAQRSNVAGLGYERYNL